MSRDRLGKGLGALLSDYLEPEAPASEVGRVPIAALAPNPVQPRRTFDERELADLAASIEQNGLLQPLVVRAVPGAADRFEVIAGERRLRAVTSLGWSDVPVLVREASDETMLVLALVENLQREELGAIEEAEGYRVLSESFGLTQAEIADSVGKDRSTVANLLRLLKLPASVRKLLEAGALSMGHARALLGVEDPARAAELARKAAAEGWSVREVERRVAGARRRPKRDAQTADPVVRALEEALQEHLATRVRIRQGRKNAGRIEITFHGADDFERIFERVAGRPASEAVG